MVFNVKSLKNKRLHFIGIGGISMSALAQMLLKENIYVQGSDESVNNEILKLKNKGIKIFKGHDGKNLKNIDAVVYSSAIAEDNIELVFARNNRLLIIKRAELLAAVASEYKTIISVAGSHGKTTATAMIAEMFLRNNLNPTVHIGGVLKSINSNYNIGSKDYFITESCEYKDNFLYMHPDLSVILNIDADHLDYFGDIDGVKRSFKKFANGTRNGGICLVCKDDENSKGLLKSANSVKFGLKNGDIIAKNIKEYAIGMFSFDVIFKKLNLGNVKLNIFGKHNIYNALAAVFVGLLCGIDFCDIKNSIESFSGTERRTEFICEKGGVRYFHDYAHHPRQIAQMVNIGKTLANENAGNLIVVYEPHTYSRTKYLINDFVISFEGVDKLYFAPVYSARENKEQGFSSDVLCEECKKLGICAELLNDYVEIKNKIFEYAKSGDIVFILGAGSVEYLAKMIKNDNIDM